MEDSNSGLPLLPQHTSPSRFGWGAQTLDELATVSIHDHDTTGTEAARTIRQTLVSPMSSSTDVDTLPSQLGLSRANPVQKIPNTSCETASVTLSVQGRDIMRSWYLEIVASFVSLGSLVAIIVTLSKEDGNLISSWTFYFSLNTVIATLGTLSRTTLAFATGSCIGQQKWSWLRRKPDTVVAFERFDEASSGPWGGTRLLFWLRFRHWAALGAFVTIGVVAFDPFFQAVIKTYGKLDTITTSSAATIGRSLSLDTGTIITGGSMPNIGYHSTVGDFSLPYIRIRPDFGVISSIYGGFHNNSKTRVEFGCSTGNCTYPAFVSAAVCSSCKDLSRELTKQKGTGYDYSNILPNSVIKADSHYTKFSLPTSEIRNFNGQADFTDHDWFKFAAWQPRTLMTVNTTGAPQETLKFSNIRTLLMSFTIIKASNEWIEAKLPWESSIPVASECALYLCAKVYQSYVREAVLNEKVLFSWTDRDPDSYRSANGWDTAKENAWIDAQGNNLYAGYNEIPRYDLRLVMPKDKSQDFPVDMARGVNISYTHIASTIQYLRSITKANAASGLGKEFQLSAAYPDADSPPFVDALWNSTNLTQTFEDVAQSMTNQMRNAGSEKQEGVVERWVLHFKVDWAYLSLPTTITVLGILYVVLTITESTRLRIPVWKERALPTLLYGFDDKTQRLLRTRAESGSAKEAMRVRFDYDEKNDCMRLLAD